MRVKYPQNKVDNPNNILISNIKIWTFLCYKQLITQLFYHIFMDSTSKALKNQIYVFPLLNTKTLGTEHTNLTEFFNANIN